jgi:hypothetical protein
MSSTTTTAPVLDWITTGWNDHAGDPEGVMERFDEAIALVAEPAHLAPLATLMAHVAANHLGRYLDGLALLDKLAALDVFDASEANGQSVSRCRAILHTCLGDIVLAKKFEDQGHPSDELPLASTQVRIRTSAAGALRQQGHIERSRELFLYAVKLAEYGPAEGDPAAGALAMNSNNLACSLEVRENRSAEDDELLELAAKTARTYWEVAGTWVQVKIAEYRLAMTYIALAQADQATDHAKLALGLCDANDGSDEDRFFPYEALARARACAKDGAGATQARDMAAKCLESASEDMREWFTESLEALDKHLAEAS